MTNPNYTQQDLIKHYAKVAKKFQAIEVLRVHDGDEQVFNPMHQYSTIQMDIEALPENGFDGYVIADKDKDTIIRHQATIITGLMYLVYDFQDAEEWEKLNSKV